MRSFEVLLNEFQTQGAALFAEQAKDLPFLSVKRDVHEFSDEESTQFTEYSAKVKRLLSTHCNAFVTLLLHCGAIAQEAFAETLNGQENGDENAKQDSSNAVTKIEAQTKQQITNLLNAHREFLLRLPNISLLLDGLQIVYNALDRANASLSGLALPERAADLVK